jgi:hypothetical protein
MLTLALGTNFQCVHMMVCVRTHDIINVQMEEHTTQLHGAHAHLLQINDGNRDSMTMSFSVAAKRFYRSLIPRVCSRVLWRNSDLEAILSSLRP